MLYARVGKILSTEAVRRKKEAIHRVFKMMQYTEEVYKLKHLSILCKFVRWTCVSMWTALAHTSPESRQTSRLGISASKQITSISI